MTTNRWIVTISVLSVVTSIATSAGLRPWRGQALALLKTEEATAGGVASVTDAARAVLDGLDATQREKATFDFGAEERFNWHFTPLPGQRKGVPLRAMTSTLKERVADLLRICLSEIGFKTVEQVRELEGILREIEGPERRFSRDPELYFTSFFGTPAPSGAWGWRFEGHHLSLNFTVRDGRIVSATPFFLGANPAIVKEGPRKGLRVLAGVEDVARELVKSLDERQLEQARGQGRPQEVAGTQQKTYDGPFPRGLSADRLKPAQRATLERLIREYTKHLPETTREDIHAAIEKGGAGRIQIAWRGGLEPLEPHSYIVHGPTFVLAYANFQNGATHIHAGLRDLRLDFGGK